MSAGEISEQVLYDPREKLFASKIGNLYALDLFVALPAARGGIRYILVCYDVFSKHVKLHAKGSHDPLVPKQIR